jgi:hypothetical protein
LRDFSSLSRSASAVFKHYFIVIDGGEYVAPGAIVTGQHWDSSPAPLRGVVHGHLHPTDDNSWYILGAHLTYLGTRWMPEFGELSAAVFEAQKGKKLGKTVICR